MHQLFYSTVAYSNHVFDASYTILNSQVPFSNPVDIESHATLSVYFLFIGLVSLAFFLVYQMRMNDTKSIAMEIAFAVVASVGLGMGTFFGMLAFNFFP